MSSAKVSSSQPNGQLPVHVPDPEVSLKVHYRRFTAEYKQRILSEAESCQAHGEIGALLRREGLYASHLSKWRQQRAHGALAGLTAKARGPQANPLAAEHAALRRETERLQAKLQRAEIIMDVQKKLCTRLGLPSEPDEQP